ncbi:MAG: isopeptide-forming domain-containing fimbrial protein [Lachnospiraceae bacterium]|nr:isopeptide-forming domain-containing fimbrial protein [Lachnospiraceae bacterium]
MKVSKIKTKWIPAAICVFLLAVLFSTLDLFPVYAANGAITTSNYKIYLNNQPLEDGTLVSKNDELSIYMNWALGNTDRETDTFELDLDSLVTNLSFPDYPESPITGNLADGTSIDVGTFQIQNGKLIIHITNPRFLALSTRTGYVYLKSTISSEIGKEQDGKDITVKVGEGDSAVERQVRYDAGLGKSGIWLSKSAVGDVYQDGQNLYQKFKVHLNAYNSNVTNVSLDDFFGNQKGDSNNIGLSEPSKITITKSSIPSIAAGATFDNIAALNAALEGLTLDGSQHQELEFEYTVKVDADIKNPKSAKNYQNTITASWTDNQNESGDDSSSAKAKFTPPTVKKEGKVSEDGTKVSWTITIKLNGLYDKEHPEKKLEEILKSIVDQALNGVTDTSARPIDLKNFQKVAGTDDTYTYTYEMTLDSQTASSSGQIELKNNVTVTTPEGYEYTGQGTTKTPGRNWLTKKWASYDEDSKTLSWKVTLDKIPSGITNVKLSDNTDSWKSNNHSPILKIYVQAGNGGSVLAVENGEPKDTSIITACQTETWNPNSFTLVFNDEYISTHAGETITITYSTQINDEHLNGKMYENTAKLTYTENGRETSYTDSDTWEKENALEKAGSIDSNKNSIRYTITVDTAKMEELTANTSITLTDTLPEGMVLDTDSLKIGVKVRYDEYTFYDVWPEDEFFKVTPSTSGADDRVVTFTIPVTQNLVEALQSETYTPTPKEIPPCLLIQYTADVKDQVEFTSQGEKKNFKNSVVGHYKDAEIGDFSTTTSMGPKDVITKTAEYTQDTAPDANYTINVNPNAIAFSNNGKLEAIDKLGSALSYNLDSIQVYKNVPSENSREENWEELEKDSDWSYTYSEENNSLTFTLPDAAYLKITYSARVNLPTFKDPTLNDWLTEENSSNTFSLSGFSSNKTESSFSFDKQAFTPRAGASANQAAFTLQKYWNNNGVHESLDGSTFKLVECRYDDTLGRMIEGATIAEDLTVDSEGKLTIRAAYDICYALYETAAKEGYVLNTEPLYLIITGAAQQTLPPGIEGRVLTNGGTLEYENEKSTITEKGQLVLTKTIEGPVTKEEAENTLEFTVKSMTSGSITTYTLKDFSYEPATGRYTLTLDKFIGDYIVTETVKDIHGYTLKSVTYQLNSGGKTNGDSIHVTVNSNAATQIDFSDTYEKDAAEPAPTPTPTPAPAPSATPTATPLAPLPTEEPPLIDTSAPTKTASPTKKPKATKKPKTTKKPKAAKKPKATVDPTTMLDDDGIPTDRRNADVNNPNAGNSNFPDTGDHTYSRSILALILACLSAMGFALTTFANRRK